MEEEEVALHCSWSPEAGEEAFTLVGGGQPQHVPYGDDGDVIVIDDESEVQTDANTLSVGTGVHECVDGVIIDLTDDVPPQQVAPERATRPRRCRNAPPAFHCINWLSYPQAPDISDFAQESPVALLRSLRVVTCPLKCKDCWGARASLETRPPRGCSAPVLPIRAQYAAHCSPFALWTAVEVVLGAALPEAPEFATMAMPRDGISMHRVLERRSARALLSQHKLIAEKLEWRGRLSTAIFNALKEGVVLAGGRVSMLTYGDACQEPHFPEIARILKTGDDYYNTGRRGVRVTRNVDRVQHSFCIVGVAHFTHWGLGWCWIIKDTQHCPFGVRGCTVLPIDEFDTDNPHCELHVIKQR